MNGELTFGGTDSSRFTGEITFTPITSTSPASNYWGIDQTVTYGSVDGTPILNQTAGIVDTGTTLLYLASDAFSAYQKATGATLDNTTGLLKLSSSEFSNLKSLFFTIGGTTFEWTANAQIWPRSMNAQLGGEEGSIYLVAADNGTPSGQGLDFINGFVWCEWPLAFGSFLFLLIVLTLLFSTQCNASTPSSTRRTSKSVSPRRASQMPRPTETKWHRVACPEVLS